MDITIIQRLITSTPSIMANHHVMVDGASSVYMHSHLYYRHSHYQTLRINKNITSTSSIIIISRHNLVTSVPS